jgi:hypothetical protein
MRTRRSVFIATRLDGFIARPDGWLDLLKTFEQSGRRAWTQGVL